MQVIKEATNALPGGHKADHYRGTVKSWNDWEHESVIKITVTVTKQWVTSIQFDYVNDDGNVYHGAAHGGSDGVKKWVSLDYEGGEYLLNVSTFAGTGNKIKSLTFVTSKRTFSTDDAGEPWITGPPCNSPTTLNASDDEVPEDRIIGFHGKADTTGLHEVIADVPA